MSMERCTSSCGSPDHRLALSSNPNFAGSLRMSHSNFGGINVLLIQHPVFGGFGIHNWLKSFRRLINRRMMIERDIEQALKRFYLPRLEISASIAKLMRGVFLRKRKLKTFSRGRSLEWPETSKHSLTTSLDVSSFSYIIFKATTSLDPQSLPILTTLKWMSVADPYRGHLFAGTGLGITKSCIWVKESMLYFSQ